MITRNDGESAHRDVLKTRGVIVWIGRGQCDPSETRDIGIGADERHVGYNHVRSLLATTKWSTQKCRNEQMPFKIEIVATPRLKTWLRTIAPMRLASATSRATPTAPYDATTMGLPGAPANEITRGATGRTQY